jgi:pyoverdine/dityrosine biosynthesis protein Dit1
MSDSAPTPFEREMFDSIDLRSDPPILTDELVIEMLMVNSRLSSGRPAMDRDITVMAPPLANEADLPALPRHYFKPKGRQGLVQQLLDVLLNSNVRRGSAALTAPYMSTFEGIVRAAVDANRPLDLTLLTLAAKAPNPLATGHAVNETDLGEELFVAHMDDLLGSLQDVYTPGARLLIVSDARAYAGYRTTPQDGHKIVAYVDGVRVMRDRRNLQPSFGIVDLVSVSHRDSNFQELRWTLEEKLRRLYDTNAAVRERLNSLSASMLTYIPLPNYDLETTNLALRVPYAELPPWVRELCFKAAINRSGFTSALNMLKVVTRAFPRALRMTVHPKAAPQLAIHLISPHSSVLPHNGVPLVNEVKLERSGDVLMSTRIVHRRDVLTIPEVLGVDLERAATSPYFYRYKGKMAE